jgi:two-component system KDP operon response regulator KdpE
VHRSNSAAAGVLEPSATIAGVRRADDRRAQPLVLIIDPDVTVRRCLESALRAQGFRVVDTATAAQGLALAAGHNPDLILLGDRTPDLDGVALTRELRTWTETPVVILSARDDELGKVTALDAGANDYLTTPFGTAELVARIRVWLRCTQRGGAPDCVLEAGGLRVDLGRRLVFVERREVHFTPIEYKLLTFFLRNPETVLTHERVLVAVWGKAHARETQYLRVFVGQLRQKLEKNPSQPRYIVTEPGVGYRFRGE